MFKIVNCNISMQICNSRNTRLGGALLACSWTGLPVQILIYAYLHCSESPPVIQDHSTSRPHSQSSLAKVQYWAHYLGLL